MAGGTILTYIVTEMGSTTDDDATTFSKAESAALLFTGVFMAVLAVCSLALADSYSKKNFPIIIKSESELVYNTGMGHNPSSKGGEGVGLSVVIDRSEDEKYQSIELTDFSPGKKLCDSEASTVDLSDADAGGEAGEVGGSSPPHLSISISELTNNTRNVIGEKASTDCSSNVNSSDTAPLSKNYSFNMCGIVIDSWVCVCLFAGLLGSTWPPLANYGGLYALLWNKCNN